MGTVCERVKKYGAFSVEAPCIKGRASPQRPLRPFGFWKGFNEFNQTVTAQLEKVDDDSNREGN